MPCWRGSSTASWRSGWGALAVSPSSFTGRKSSTRKHHSSQPTWGSSSDTGVTVREDCGPTACPQPHGRCLRWDICAHLCVPGLREAAQTPSLLPSPQNHVSGQARWPPGTQHRLHLAKPHWVHMDGATTPHIFHPHHTSPHALQLPRAAWCAVGRVLPALSLGMGAPKP